MRGLEDMAKAFSFKLWWHLRKQDSVWADFVFSKYIGEQHLMAANLGNPTWKRLLGIRELAEKGIRWSLGSGLVDLWRDTWCGEALLSQLVP